MGYIFTEHTFWSHDMLSLLITTLSGLFLFAMGCYLGYQVGSTRSIREQLAKAKIKGKN